MIDVATPLLLLTQIHRVTNIWTWSDCIPPILYLSVWRTRSWNASSKCSWRTLSI